MIELTYWAERVEKVFIIFIPPVRAFVDLNIMHESRKLGFSVFSAFPLLRCLYEVNKNGLTNVER